MTPASSDDIIFICGNIVDSCYLMCNHSVTHWHGNDCKTVRRLCPQKAPMYLNLGSSTHHYGFRTVPFQICDRANTAKMHNLLICCVQEAVEQLVANIASLAAPASLFCFDFLHLDMLKGGTKAIGYVITVKASLYVVHSVVSDLHLLEQPQSAISPDPKLGCLSIISCVPIRFTIHSLTVASWTIAAIAEHVETWQMLCT